MSELNEYEDLYFDKKDIKAAFIGSLPGDTPLLEELGINFNTIKTESKLIFEVLQKSPSSFNCKSADCVGPILFYFLYSTFLLINGKFHFGYIYFLSIISNFFIYFLLNVLGDKSINIFESFSGLGYSHLPITIFAFVNIFLRYFSFYIRLGFGGFFAIWAAVAGTKVFISFLELDRLYLIVGYPLFLIYFCFALIVIF